MVFYLASLDMGYLSNSTNVGNIDFTGQHRCISSEQLEQGYIVSSTGTINNLNTSFPQINESLPEIELSKKENDKKVFGVISEKEDETSKRTYSQGIFTTVFEKSDCRYLVNSLCEGAV